MTDKSSFGMLSTITAMVFLGILIFALSVNAEDISGPYTLADTEYDEDYPDIAIDSENGFHVIYPVYDYDANRGWLEYLKVSTTGSVVREPITISGPNMEYLIHYDIVVDTSDRVHVVFSSRNLDGEVDIYYTQLTVDGKIEITPVKFPNNVETQSYPSLDVDSSGNVYIVYLAWEGQTPSIMWMKLSSSGTVLRPAQRISDEADYPNSNGVPTICVDPTGKSYVVWVFGTYINSIVRTSIYYTSLTSTGSVDVEPTEVLANQVADYWGVEAGLDSDDELHLTYIIRDPVRSDALGYARIDEDGGVADEQRLDDPRLSGEAWWPDIDVDPSDDIYVVYQRMSNDYVGDWNIHLMMSTDGGRNWDDSLQLTTDGSSQSTKVAAGFGIAGVVYGYNHGDVYMVTVGEEITNEPPVASLIVSPQNPDIRQQVEFDGRDSYDPDTNDHVEMYFFDFGDGSNSGWIETPRVTLPLGYTNAGTYTASLRVRDSYGRECTSPDTVTIVVQSEPTNQAPTASLSVVPGTADIDEEVVFNGGSSYDPDGSVAEYTFDFGDGMSTGWVTQSSVSHSYNSEAYFTATLRVRDDEGAESDPATVTITIVHVNEPPSATIDSIEPNPVMEGDMVTLTGLGDDPDGTIKAYSWESDLDGILGNTAIVTIDTLRIGVHTISFKVRDDEDVWSKTVTETLLVSLNQDFALEDRTSKREVRTDGEMHFKVLYTDIENDPPTMFNLLYAKGNVWKEVQLEEYDPEDQDFTDGKEYRLVKEFGVGAWKYAFEFENAKNLRKTTDVREFEVLEESAFPIPALGIWPVLLAMLVVALATVLRRRN